MRPDVEKCVPEATQSLVEGLLKRLEEYRAVSGEFAARGNLVPDAHLAALLRQHGVSTLYTADADFRRFDFLDVRNPFRTAGPQ